MLKLTKKRTSTKDLLAVYDALRQDGPTVAFKTFAKSYERLVIVIRMECPECGSHRITMLTDRVRWMCYDCHFIGKNKKVFQE